MEDDEAGFPKLSKRFGDKAGGGGEVDFKLKSGTAWSHSYLNQKPWHPLSYPNQRRKWIAEQTHAQRQRRLEEVSREYAQEQDFLRQTSLLSQKDKEKVDIMQAVSFMYVRPPGYNAESAKAAEIVDEKRKLRENGADGSASSSMPQETAPVKEEKKKPRPKDVFGRALPTEEEFAALKNAPRLETGVAGRAKPFAVEIRNVKCVRCGNFGHQSGDRECPLKDVIMPSEESRLKRDDPLTAIMAQVEPSEPLNWELKQKPGLSPPRGGFQPDDPNQQIVAEDIFDEYGGFLGGGLIPELLSNFSSKKHKKKTKSKQKSMRHGHEDGSSDSDDGERSPKTKSKSKQQDTSTRSRKQGDDYTSDSDNDRKSTKSKFKSNHKIKKRGSVTDSYEDDRCASDDDLISRRTKSKASKKEASTRARKRDDYSRASDTSQIRSDRDDDRRRRKTKSKTKQKEASTRRRRMDDYTSDIDKDRRSLETKHNRHRKQLGSYSDCYDEDGGSDRDDDLRRWKTKSKSKQKESSTRRRKSNDYTSDTDNGRRGSMKQDKSTHRELKKPYSDGFSDDERKSRRKGKRHRKHSITRSDSEFSSSENSEFDRRRKGKRHQKHSTSRRASEYSSSENSKSDRQRKGKRHRKHSNSRSYSEFSSSENSEYDRQRRKSRHQ